VQVPDIEVIRAQLAQAGIQMILRLLALAGQSLARNDHLLAPAFQSRAHHTLIVAVLVTPRRIEVD